ncbi:MAG TPA: SPFH domain-containing protein [Kofleriaceae bacterium]|nr:SPFH domain-containing protein [Kofleriaceae bacterium]
MIPVLLGIAAVIAFSVVVVVIRLIHICSPNEILIFYGRSHRDTDGKVHGYRLVHGGRGTRTPLFEKVTRMDLSNMIIDLKITGAYSKGGIPLNVDGIANVKIASRQPIIGNAIERFLDKPRQEIITVARETLEGNLRGVLATLTPEDVNQDRDKFAERLTGEADDDLEALGLELDSLKIQHVSDDKGYLDSLGRRQSAELIMKSRVAEAENKAIAAERGAENFRNQEGARLDADIAEARADARRRIIDARTRKDAMVAEERSTVTAAVARAQAELKVQEARLSQVRLRLMADEIKPAEAQREQMEQAARGAAAYIIEEGKATAEALRTISETWAQAGDNAREIFVAQKLSGLIGHMMSTVDKVTVDKVTFIDSKLTNGNNLAVKAAVTSEQLKHTLGVDLPELLRKFGATPSSGIMPSSGLKELK